MKIHEALISIGLALALSISFFLQPLRPWPDQGWTLQAAIRHAKGQGLTTQMNSSLTDISRPAFRRLTYFPPVYPLLVSALIQAGLTVVEAVKLINALALVAGCAGWLTLASRVMPDSWTRWLLLALLVVANGAIVPRSGTTDYVFWSLLPWWILMLVDVDGDGVRLWHGVAAGGIAAFLVGFRWAALFLVPAAGLYLLWLLVRRRIGGLKFVIQGIVALGIPVAAFLAISVQNGRSSPHSSNYLSFLTANSQPENLKTLFPFEALVTGPIGIDTLLHRLVRLFDPAESHELASGIVRGLLPAALLTLAFAVWRPRPEGSASNAFKILSVATLGTTLAALAFLSVFFNWKGIDWSYLIEPRYYRPLLPLAALTTILFLSRRVPTGLARACVFGCMGLGAAYLLQADARWEIAALRSPDEVSQLFAFESTLASRPGLQVVFDSDVSELLINDLPNVVAWTRPDPDQIARLNCSRPANVWIVRRLSEKSAYERDPRYDEMRFKALRKRFPSELAWRSTGGAFEVYGARFVPKGPGV